MYILYYMIHAPVWPLTRILRHRPCAALWGSGHSWPQHGLLRAEAKAVVTAGTRRPQPHGVPRRVACVPEHLRDRGPPARPVQRCALSSLCRGSGTRQLPCAFSFECVGSDAIGDGVATRCTLGTSVQPRPARAETDWPEALPRHTPYKCAARPYVLPRTSVCRATHTWHATCNVHLACNVQRTPGLTRYRTPAISHATHACDATYEADLSKACNARLAKAP